MSELSVGRRDGRTAMHSVAAILLVLHWILPGGWQAGVAPSERGPAPGYASALWAAQPFNLPRLQPRVVSLESSLPKGSEESRACGGQAVLQPAVAGEACAYGARRLASGGSVVASAGSASAFDARGPPIRG